MKRYKQIFIHILGWFTFVLFIGLLFYMQNGFIPKPIFLNIAFGIILLRSVDNYLSLDSVK